MSARLPADPTERTEPGRHTRWSLSPPQRMTSRRHVIRAGRYWQPQRMTPGAGPRLARMPSIQHAIASRVIPIMRRNMSPDDIPAMRASMARDNRMTQEGPPQDVRRTHEESISNHPRLPGVHPLAGGDGGPGARGGLPARRRLRAPLGRPALEVRHPAGRRPRRPRGAAGVSARLPSSPSTTPSRRWSRSSRRSRASHREGVVLAGDSAGGGYALALAEALRDRGGSQPDRPGPDRALGRSHRHHAGHPRGGERDPWLSFTHLSIYASFWAGTEDPDGSPTRASAPALGDLARPATDADALRDA